MYGDSERGVAQMVARMVWDHEVAGSRPVTPTNMQVSYIGNTPAFQAGKVGSIPTTCSNKFKRLSF